MEKPLLVHKHENLLYGLCILTTISLVFYLLISIVGVIIFAILAVISLLSHAISMAHIQVNSVRIKETQFPDLYSKVKELCTKMEISKIPEVYIVESGGILNAFATRIFGLFGKNMVILYSDFVDISLDSKGNELDYVIAHELSHIKRNHVVKSLLVFPAMWIPFIGVSYSRMAEYTCDRMAAYYTNNPADAINGLLILAVGRRLYKDVNLTEYQEQYNDKKGIFVTLAELLSTHPPIPKRIQEIETLMFGIPTVPLISRGKQTFAILFIVFFLFPIAVAGLTFVGIMAIEKINFFDEFPIPTEYTPLMEAAQEGDVDKVNELVNEGANPNEMNEFEENALFIAIVNEHKEVVQILLDHGADPNLQDSYGWTPLMSAVMTENIEIGKMLLEAGADPLLTDVDDMSSLDHAEELQSSEYVNLLNDYVNK
ncbi:M48 family metallopeptidase [Fredinandcohnia humi]